MYSMVYLRSNQRLHYDSWETIFHFLSTKYLRKAGRRTTEFKLQYWYMYCAYFFGCVKNGLVLCVLITLWERFEMRHLTTFHLVTLLCFFKASKSNFKRTQRKQLETERNLESVVFKKWKRMSMCPACSPLIEYICSNWKSLFPFSILS